MESMISTTNYMSKAVCSYSDEESSWTFYLDDEDENDSLLISGCGASSMASEAASSSLKKRRFNNRKGPTRMSAKRRKTRVVFVDQDLEDTASSPDHTPKANDFNQLLRETKDVIGSKGIFQEHNLFQTVNKQPDDGVCIGTSQGKGNSSDQNSEEIDFVGKESYYTELRRKGLRLVPVSMIFNCIS